MLQIPEETLREMYVNRNMTTREVAKEMGHSYSAIRKAIIRCGIPMRPQTHRRRVIPDLAEMYQKYSVREIAEITGRCHASVTREMEKSGVKRDPLLHAGRGGSPGHSNPDPIGEFFLVDSRDLYYTVGFVASDGNIGTGCVGVTIAQMERKVLEDIGRLFGRIPTGLNNGNGMYSLSLGGKLLAEHFGKKWGIHPNKSKTIRLQGVPDEYFGDWLRGYFDGNGSVLNPKKDGAYTGAHIGISSGSSGLLEDIRYRLSLLGANYPTVYTNSRGWGTSHSIKYGKTDSLMIYDLMYGHGGIYLERKKVKFDDLRELFPLGGKRP